MIIWQDFSRELNLEQVYYFNEEDIDEVIFGGTMAKSKKE
ncbi:hypothetical protein B8V60_05165 [Streptococcus agalactiae]|nr:hypothetical protein B8V09_02465 [Streptococcus agalactiae]KAF1126683.1 hypothetical protein B8U92_05260 [Streptococcus agalactiae]KAF1137873.1 hypothetical protein B8V14_08535 [Streptococcus agalactiae]KAF1144718.1 hypothetical protein B8V13_05905 [Streptococcus agalactiae]KAF1145073.1 hypothetical protein B8V16_07990 [Streptococcus agalactiae]